MKVKEHKVMLDGIGSRLKKLLSSLDDVQKEHPISGLRINDRAKAALISANYRTVSDICLADCEDIVRLKNVGDTSLSKLCLDLEREYNIKHESYALAALIKDASDGMKYQDIVFRRLGMNGYKRETLASIGGKFTMTRERIRQIESTVLGEVMSGLRGAGVRDQIRFLQSIDIASPEAEAILVGIDRPDKALQTLNRIYTSILEAN